MPKHLLIDKQLTANASELFFQPWHKIALPDRAMNTPGMIRSMERNLLYYLAKKYWTGWGKIIDAGCFAGASTVCFAMGIEENTCKANKEKCIISYDLFEATEYIKNSQAIQKLLRNAQTDEAFFAEFIKNTDGYGKNFTLEKGDITKKTCQVPSVEILFLDVAKKWNIMNWVLQNFFSRLKRGSVLIHQDFYDYRHYYLPFVMGYLNDYFELIEFMEPSNAIFFCIDEIPEFMLNKDLRKEISLNKALEYHYKFMPRGNILHNAIFHIQACHLALWYDDCIAAREIFEESYSKYKGFPRVRVGFELLKTKLLRDS